MSVERYTPFRRVSTAGDNVAAIKTQSGEVGYIFASNINAAIRYLHLFDTLAAPTLGTTVPKLTVALPGAATGGLAQPAFVGPVVFDVGIWIAITTTVDGATGNVAANEQIVNIGWN